MKTLDEFKEYLAEHGHPNVELYCPECWLEPEDELDVVEGLQAFEPYPMDAGGHGWACICCARCGNHYAVDISA